MYKTSIFKTTIKTAFGTFVFAVNSTAQDAKTDIFTIASAEFKMRVGQLRLGEIKKSNRRILSEMHEIKQAQSNGKCWAWMRRI